MSRAFKGKPIAIAAGLVSAAAFAALSFSGLSVKRDFGQPVASPKANQDSLSAQRGGRGATDVRALAQRNDRPVKQIIVFRDPALASYRGGVRGAPRPERNASGQLDARGANSQAYVNHLEQKQFAYVDRINQTLGRQLKVDHRMQHGLNAVVATLSPLEAEAISKLPEVLFVQPNRDILMDTDVGPELIGATNVWAGIAGSFGDGPAAARGEGIVFGSIDSGINYGSPSFAATDPLDGYVHANPNGSGNFLGQCAPGGIDEGNCNDKLIGGWDFVCGPPANVCGTADTRDEPSFADTDGHGSHTASTAAGNSRTENFNGAIVTFSGVAPRANVIGYDVCYHRISTGQGLCPFVSSAAAVDQAIADGVDVINFSIGGGASPWTDAVSLAFLNATNAGIFVATSAGNSGPGAGTLGHVEPWTTSSAAAQHGRAGYNMSFSVTGPGTPPAGVQNIIVNAGTNGVGAGPLPGTTPLVVSPGIDAADDGCNAFPANTFQNAIAVVRRGTCSFSIKTNNAAAAGAIAIVIANNTATPPGIIPSVPGTTIPAYGMTQADANAVRDFAAGATGETASLTAVTTTNTVDALASFSSRGPSGFDLLKPDITSPGVNILAVLAGTTPTGFENLIGTISGTSMASPHTAGAAILMRQLHPNWSVMEIKSALQLTASESVLLEDQVTPANWHAGGAGRTQVDFAARAGLVLNESYANMLGADPDNGGDPGSLNLATMEENDCTGGCTFVRTVRNTRIGMQSWEASLDGFSGSVSPSSFTLKFGQSRQVTVTIDGASVPTDGSYGYGAVRLTPTAGRLRNGDTTLPELHMPIAVRQPPPPPPSTPLTNGVPVTVAGAADSQTHFTLDVPSGSGPVTFTITDGGSATGDADLHVRFGQYPTLGEYDCRPWLIGNEESCTFDPSQAGTYHVMVHAYPLDGPIADIVLTGSY